MATPEIDIFQPRHRQQRQTLFEIGLRLGQIQPESSKDIEAIVNDIQGLILSIKAHSDGENTFIIPLLTSKGLDLGKLLGHEHEKVDIMLDELEAKITKFPMLNSDELSTFIYELYRDFNCFMGHYLLHTHWEETEIMPMLRTNCSREEIMGILVAFKTYSEPSEAEKMLPALLKGMTVEERSEMYASIEKTSPREAYQASLLFEEKAFNQSKAV